MPMTTKRKRGDYYPDTCSRGARALLSLRRDRAELDEISAAGVNVDFLKRMTDDLMRWRASGLIDTGAPR